MKKRISVGMESAMIRKIFLLSYLGVLSVWDIKEKKVPLLILLAGWGIVLYSVVTKTPWNTWSWPGEAFRLLPALLPGFILLIAAKITGKVGSADGMVLLQLSMLMEYPACVLLFWVSILLVFAFCVVMFLSRRVHKNSRVPYLPFLLASCFIL